jgi:hypothetical protein
VRAITTSMVLSSMSVVGREFLISLKMEGISFGMPDWLIMVAGSISMLEWLAKGSASAYAQGWAWISSRVPSPGSLLLPPDRVGRAGRELGPGGPTLRVLLDLPVMVLLSDGPCPGRAADGFPADSGPGELLSPLAQKRRFLLGGVTVPGTYEARRRDGDELLDIFGVKLNLAHLN